MTIRLREISHIPRHIIKSGSRRRRRKQRRAALSLDEKGPLVAAGMPVNLAHAAGVHGHDGCGEVLGDGEGGWVDYLDGAAGDAVGGLLGEVVGVGLGAGDEAGGG